MDFTNKVAISTGAASGMGLLFAQEFAKLGGNVVLCDVNEEKIKEVAIEINSHNKGKAIAIYCDVRKYEQVTNVIDVAVKKFGRIDIVCNFAGGTAVRMQKVDREKYKEFPDVPIEVFDWGIRCQLKRTILFCTCSYETNEKTKYRINN